MSKVKAVEVGTVKVKVNRTAVGSFRYLLKSCQSLIDLVPTKNDNLTQKLLKCASLLEFGLESLQDESNLYTEYTIKNNLVNINDMAFKDVFINTAVSSLFKEETIHLDEEGDKVLIKFISNFGSLYFREKDIYDLVEDDNGWRHSSKSNGASYWSSPNFDFAGVLHELWNLFDNKINIHLEDDNVRYTQVSVSNDPFAGKASEWVEVLIDKHLKYKKDSIPRACLFVGPPGVGKSTLVMKIADKIGQRILRMEANFISRLNPTNLTFFLEGLRPDCIIIDDVDRASMNGDLSTMFTVLDWMKIKYPGVPLFMTANRVSHLDTAFMRPGRIDEVLWFNLPDDKDRLILLDTYLNLNKVSLSSEQKEIMVEATKGMAVPWIKEIALQLRYEIFEDVLRLIDSMQKLKTKLKYSYGEDDEEEYQDDYIDVASDPSAVEHG